MLNLGMSEEARLLVTSAHTDAYARKLYPTGCYMASNPDEYWAEGTQARPTSPASLASPSHGCSLQVPFFFGLHARGAYNIVYLIEMPSCTRGCGPCLLACLA